jgi:type VI secretion system secreted protein VgrG
MEVMVTFLAGDQDTPIIIGCTYNATQPPPFHLPAERTRSGIRTRSTPGGDGYNEIAFGDTKGSESVSIRAERNFAELVLHDHSVDVRNDQAIHVAADQRVTVDGGQALNVHGDQRVTVGGSAAVVIAGNHTEAVAGDRSETVTRDRRVTVHGQETKTVHGHARALIERDHALTVNGHHSVTIGLGSEGARSSHFVRGDHFLTTTGIIRASADGALVLQCGESRIEITPHQIKISAASLILEGSESASLSGKGPSMNLGENAEIVAKKLVLLTPDASVKLDGDASVRGKRVLLNCDKLDGLTKPAEAVAPESLRSFKLAVKDPELQPYKDKRYALLIDGVKREGQTTADGMIDEKIPREATRAALVVWIDAYPTGRKLEYQVDLRDLAPAATAAGAHERLSNLGYHAGDPKLASGDELKRAVAWFQRDHDIKQTGELDGPTLAEIENAHGH